MRPPSSCVCRASKRPRPSPSRGERAYEPSNTDLGARIQGDMQSVLGLVGLVAIVGCAAEHVAIKPPPGCGVPGDRAVMLLGDVLRPGPIAPAPGLTVYQAIAGAGGFTPLAHRRRLRLTRCRRVIQFEAPLAPGAETDFELLPGDTI